MANPAATFDVRTASRTLWLGLAATLQLCGCGEPSANIEKTVRASGALVHRGNPLPHYQVMFHPLDGRRPATGVSDEKGRFILGTNGENDGAVAGKHRVTVVYIGPPSPSRDGMIDFSPAPPPKIKIAAKYTSPETSGIEVDVPSTGSTNLKIEIQ